MHTQKLKGDTNMAIGWLIGGVLLGAALTSSGSSSSSSSSSSSTRYVYKTRRVCSNECSSCGRTGRLIYVTKNGRYSYQCPRCGRRWSS